MVESEREGAAGPAAEGNGRSSAVRAGSVFGDWEEVVGIAVARTAAVEEVARIAAVEEREEEA